jgi:hypothetical protein
MKNKIRELWWTLTSSANMAVLVVQVMFKYNKGFKAALIYIDDLLKAQVKAAERDQKHLVNKARKKIRHRVMRHYV